MSQSTHKKQFKAYKKEAKKAARGDYARMVDDLRVQKHIIRRQKIAIICLSVLSFISITGGVIYGLFF